MFRSGEETTFGLFGLTLRGPLGRCFHAHFLFFFFSGFLSNFFLQVGLSKMGVGVGFGVSFFTLTAQCIEGGSALPRYTFLTKHRCSLTPRDDDLTAVFFLDYPFSLLHFMVSGCLFSLYMGTSMHVS